MFNKIDQERCSCKENANIKGNNFGKCFDALTFWLFHHQEFKTTFLLRHKSVPSSWDQLQDY